MRVWEGIELNSREAATRCPARLCVPLACGLAYCQATDSRINNATAVLRGLLYLLIDQQPMLISHIQKQHDLAGKSLFEDANAWVPLSVIFTNVLQDPSLKSTYLIIDALDECVAADLPKLLDFLMSSGSSLVGTGQASRRNLTPQCREYGCALS